MLKNAQKNMRVIMITKNQNCIIKKFYGVNKFWIKFKELELIL